MRLRTLATDENIRKAVIQVSEYCPSLGCENACVTNGHEFIIFRAFIPGHDFMSCDALVIPALEFFSQRYTEAYNLLSFSAIIEDRMLQKALIGRLGTARELFYPKNGIAHYDAPVQKNPYARYLDPLARYYFGDILPTDKRMMTRCYVFSRATEAVETSIKQLITDSITPYFKADGAEEISEYRSGGRLVQRIARSLVSGACGEVLILYGGKGSGKSTFLRKLFYHEPPSQFDIHAFPIIADCLRSPQEKAELSKHVWEQIITALDQDGLLSSPMEALVKLFEDRFDVATRQDLAGFAIGSSEYLQERNRLVLKWREDNTYVAKRLRTYWEKKGKILVLALDNTDHLPPLLQDHCFLLAHSIARELSCVVIISMREERYCRARTIGVLDAYHNRGFHLAAPLLHGVFVKRLKLLIEDLSHTGRKHIEKYLPVDAPFVELASFFGVCLRQFSEHGNAMQKFLQEASHDNTRIALDFFSQYMSSGYTHIEEMIGTPSWTVISHQMIKPMMVPERYNYDENKSLIPNVYQCRTSLRGSHFTMLRLLTSLLHNGTEASDHAGFYGVTTLIDDFESRFGMRQDCESAIDIILSHGLAEASNRLDCYKVEKTGTDGREFIYADEIKITAFGRYMLEYLCETFTYIDLVSLDCGLSNEGLYNDFCAAAMRERAMGTVSDKEGRLNSRLIRARSFVDYLVEEETKEKSEFLLDDNELFMPRIVRAFADDCERVEQSAKRTFKKSWRTRDL